MSCPACQSWFTANAVRPGDAADLYTNGQGDLHWHADAFELAKTREVVRSVDALLRPGQVVVDVGCNTGELLDHCRRRGAVTFGIELSDTARTVCAAKGHCLIDALNQAPSPSDLVFAFDLVEHLYDVVGFLRTARDALRPGGRLVVLTGDNTCLSARTMSSRWWYARYPEHVVFPSWRSWRNCRGFTDVTRLRTYASPGYRTAWYRRWRTALAALAGRGNGLPPLGPDHHLLILTR